METPYFLTTADGECVGFSPSGTDRRGRAAGGGGGRDSFLRAALAASGVTPFNSATCWQPRAQSSALTVPQAMFFGPVLPMVVSLADNLVVTVR